VAEALSRLVPDSNRGVIYQFAMDRQTSRLASDNVQQRYDAAYHESYIGSGLEIDGFEDGSRVIVRDGILIVPHTRRPLVVHF
jgi:hypothetical protein